MRKLICFLFLFFPLSIWAQLTLDFQAKQPFLLEVNGHVINGYPCERLVFDVVLEETKCMVKTTLLAGPMFNQSIVLKPGYKTEYQLGKDKKDNWKWQILGETTIVLDTLSLNEIPSLVEVFEAHGKCLSPMKKSDFQHLLDQCALLHKSEEKLKLITSATQEICCTVEQLSQLLAHMELEDDKLELLVEMVDKIYNWQERGMLVEAFFTERAQQKAATLLQ